MGDKGFFYTNNLLFPVKIQIEHKDFIKTTISVDTVPSVAIIIYFVQPFLIRLLASLQQLLLQGLLQTVYVPHVTPGANMLAVCLCSAHSPSFRNAFHMCLCWNAGLITIYHDIFF